MAKKLEILYTNLERTNQQTGEQTDISIFLSFFRCQKKSLKTRECADLGDGEAVGDDVVPGVAGVGGAQIGDGEGEGRADQVKCVHQG